MKVSLIGGTGFVGSYIVDRLVESGYTPRLLVRPGSASRVERSESCEAVPGDVDDAKAVAECLTGTDAVIYLIGILRELPARGIRFEGLQFRGVQRVVQAAREGGVRRILLMSANGVRAGGTPYQTTKYMAEETVKSSGLDWTIFRPSVIFGNPRGRMEFCTQLRREIIDSPLPAPLFYDGLLPSGAGTFKLAPVQVADVAAAFVRALQMPETIGRSFQLCGPDSLTWKRILATIAAAVGKTKPTIPAPAVLIKAVASLLDSRPWFPITRDQIAMLLEGNVCDDSSAFAILGIDPTPFDEASLRYLRNA